MCTSNRRSYEFKKKIVDAIQTQPADKLQKIMEILVSKNGIKADQSGSVEVDIDKLNTDTLKELAVILGLNQFT